MQNNSFMISYWNEENEFLKNGFEGRQPEIWNEKIANEIKSNEEKLPYEERKIFSNQLPELLVIYNYLQNHFQFTCKIEGYYYEDFCGKSGWIYINDLPRLYNWSKNHLKKGSKSKQKSLSLEKFLLKKIFEDKKTKILQMAENLYKDEKEKKFLNEFEKLFSLLPKKIIFSLTISELISFIKTLYNHFSLAKLTAFTIRNSISQDIAELKNHISKFDDHLKDDSLLKCFSSRLIHSSNFEELSLIIQWYKSIVLRSFFDVFYKKYNIDGLKLLSNQSIENIFKILKEKILRDQYIYIYKNKPVEINDNLIYEFGLDESYRNEYAQATNYEDKQNYKKAAKLYYTAGKIATEEANTWENIAINMDDDECYRIILNLSSVYYIKATHFFTQSFTALCQYGASKGDILSIGQLAKCYMEGLGTFPEDHTKAIQLFNQAAEQGDRFSMYELGKCYFEGLGVRKNSSEAFKWFEASSRNKNRYSFVTVANSYKIALGISQDYTDLHANKKSEVNCLLAKHYLDGLEVKKNKFKATRHYTKAAKQGSFEAIVALGKLYAEEENPSIKDAIEQTFTFLKDEVSKGVIEANYLLGLCFEYGAGTTQNISEAIRLYWEANKKCHLKSRERLGRLEKTIKHGFDKLSIADCGDQYDIDIKQIFSFLQAEASKGVMEGNYFLGLCFEYGFGTMQDLSEAILLYWEASKKGHLKASAKLEQLEKQNADKLYMIACGYQHGIDSIEDHSIAAIYFRQAAEKGNVPAMCRLAKLYENGDGVNIDNEWARKWYREAAKRKHPYALKKLKDSKFFSIEENDNLEISLNETANQVRQGGQKVEIREKKKTEILEKRNICNKNLLIELEEKAKLAKIKILGLLRLKAMKHSRITEKTYLKKLKAIIAKNF